MPTILGITASQISGHLGTSPFIGITNSNSLYSAGNASVSGTKIALASLDAGNTYRYIMLLDNGVISWQKQIAMQNPAYATFAEFSANGNVIVAGDSQSQNNAHLTIFSSTGTEIAQKQYTTGTGTGANNLITDSSNNIFIAGSSNGSQRCMLLKVNSSGIVQWSPNYTVVNYSGGFQDVDLDSSGNIYTCGYIEGGYQGVTVKYNSAGSPQWYANMRGNSTPSSGEGNVGAIGVSPAGDSYVGGGYSTSGGANRKPVLFKYNSSGTLQWQREFAYNTSSNTYYYDVAVGADGFIYGVWGNYIGKYNSSGTLQWQRKLTTATVIIGSIKIVNDVMYIGLKINGYNSVMVLPTDGSKTGTYTVSGNTVVYEAGTGTEQAGNALTTTASMTAGTSSLTTTDPGRAIANTSFTFTKVNV
jgi:hypothetical protein